MRTPAKRTLCETFRLEPRSAQQIKSIGAATSDGAALQRVIETSCPHTAAYTRSCGGGSSPWSTMASPFRAYDSHPWRVTVALHAIDTILGTHGVEPLSADDYSLEPPDWEYLNAGDPYATTLIYHRRTDTLRIGCWGDIAERYHVG